MAKQLDPVLEHIRLMKDRIEQQTRLVQKLRKSGADAAAAIRRLDLLKSVLTEMRLQLGQLARTEADIKRKSAAPGRRQLPKKK